MLVGTLGNDVESGEVADGIGFECIQEVTGVDNGTISCFQEVALYPTLADVLIEGFGQLRQIFT